METNISELVGKTITKVEVDKDNSKIIFTTIGGDKYKLYHLQDCCESVTIEDIEGDILDLVDSPILVAEEVDSEQFDKDFMSKFSEKNEYGLTVDKIGNYKPESHTWTFYKLATIKGYVTIRFYGESNGYYSESVDFVKADENGAFPEW